MCPFPSFKAQGYVSWESFAGYDHGIAKFGLNLPILPGERGTPQIVRYVPPSLSSRSKAADSGIKMWLTFNLSIFRTLVVLDREDGLMVRKYGSISKVTPCFHGLWHSVVVLGSLLALRLQTI